MTDDSLSDEDADSLEEILATSCVMSQFEKTPHLFLPQRKFEAIVTREIIRSTLYGESDSEDEALINYFVNDARKLFAITVLTGLSMPEYLIQAMCLFKDRGFSDDDLPIEDLLSVENEQTSANRKPVDLSTHTLGGIGEPWTSARIHTFYHEQWKLLAPVFSMDEANDDLGIHTIPFIAKNEEVCEGSFGYVRRYRIHSDHIQGSTKANDQGV